MGATSPSPRNRHRPFSLAWAVTAIVAVMAPVGVSAAPRDRAQAAPVPRFSGAVPGRMARLLTESLALAVHRVHERPGCAQLFADLAADGERLLSLTLYRAPARKTESKWCREGRAAFTAVGSPLTCICPSFGRLSRQGGATILIHEALHFAGLEERPAVPTALDSREINRMVRERCDL